MPHDPSHHGPNTNRHRKGVPGRHRLGRSRSLRALAAAALSAALFVTGLVELNLSAAGNADAALSTTTISLAPVADSYVTSAAPGGVLGFEDQIQASDISGHHKRAYLRFRLPTLSGETVVKARLVLTRTNHHLAGSVQLHNVTNTSWTEGGLRWGTAPPVGTVLDSVDTNATMDTVAFTVPTSAFAGNDVSLALTSPSLTDFVAFRSRESGTGAPSLQLGLQPTTSPAVSSTTSSTPTQSPTSPASSSPSASPASTSAAANTSPATASSTSTGAASGCTVSAKLVPSCGYWWGIAPKAHTTTPRDVALAEDEQEAQTNFTLMHTYHENDQLFPNAMERDMAFESGKNRVLLINWKPATDMTWAAVAKGQADARIDRLAGYIKSNFPYPFFLAIWHEPENDVDPTTGSGMTASDYAAMFRHVVLRLRTDGATKPVIVMNYMGFDNYALNSWFPQLWPGDDVVDWIGIDPYGSGTSGVYQSGDFNKLVNRKITGFPGYYTWATTNHPGKPIMLSEWGVNEGTNDPSGKAAYLDSVSQYLPNYPAIKSLAYFDENNPSDPVAATTTPDSSTQSLDAFRRLCNWADARGPHPTYSGGSIGLAG
jgi:hypothetical protein